MLKYNYYFINPQILMYIIFSELYLNSSKQICSLKNYYGYFILHYKYKFYNHVSYKS